MDGDKLYKYLKNNGNSMDDNVNKSTFSKAKIYNLFKRFSIDQDDKIQICKDFDLPVDFFDTSNVNVLNEPRTSYKTEDLLREIIEQKDLQIKMLNERIEELKKKR